MEKESVENKRYGYLDEKTAAQVVSMQKGQNIAGYPIGIIYIEDVYYPMLPGNIVNGYTFSFPTRLKAVKGLDIATLFKAEDETLPAILKACKDLQEEGVRAISGACGFFGNYQREIAREIDIPVALSSLMQVPWILSLLRPKQKIGILTADKSSVTERLLSSCGIGETMRERISIADLRYESEFSCILEGRGSFDNAIVQKEVVGKALSLVKKHDLGAILLECSDLPPYAAAIQATTKLPVFDFTTLIRWLQTGVCQKPYKGYI